MAERIFRTENDYTITAMRLILGIVFFAHGAQKALGWFDGPGLDGTVALFSNMGIGEPLPWSRLRPSFLPVWAYRRVCGANRRSRRDDKYVGSNYSRPSSGRFLRELAG